MKKMFALLAALILTATACSQKADGPSASSSAKPTSESAAPSQPPAKKDPVTLKLSLSVAYAEVFHTYIDPIIKEKLPYITLEYVDPPAKLKDMITAGNTPDIYMQNNSLNQAFDLGLQYDLNDLVKNHNFDLGKLDPDLIKSVKAFGSKGELYALPSDRSVRVLLYNKDIFDKFGVEYPKDGMKWDEVFDLAKRLSRTDGGVDYHGLIVPQDQLRSQLELHTFGADGLKANLTTPGWEKVAQTWQDLASIPGNYIKGDGRTLFTKDRKLAMLLTNSPFLLRNPIDDLNWDYVVAPTFDNGLIPDKLGSMLCIASSSDKKDAAFDLLNLYFSDEVQVAIAKSASLVSGSNVPEIVKQYGADTPANKGRNLKADFSGHAATTVVEKYDYVANPILNKAFNDIQSGAKDINTALRDATEEINKKVAEVAKQ